MLQNPFVYGRPVIGDKFWGRTEQVKMLRGLIMSHQNTVLVGERRVGKTSLVMNTAQILKGFSVVKTHFQGVKSVDAACKRLISGIAAMEKEDSKMRKIMQMLSRFRVAIALERYTLDPILKFDIAHAFQPEDLEEVFRLLKQIGTERKGKFVVALDEFQDLLRVPDANELMAMMRGYIQFQTDVTYLYIGSIRHEMVDIFTKNDSPFLKSATIVEVGPLEEREFIQSIVTQFKKGGLQVSKPLISEIIEITRGNPGDTQQLCHSLFNVSSPGKAIGEEKLSDALQEIYSCEGKLYEEYIKHLTEVQIRMLLSIAQLGGKGVYSKAFMSSARVTNSAVIKHTVARLLDRELIFLDSQKEYRFVNPFFRKWLMIQGIA